jgi:hypothetical protein
MKFRAGREEAVSAVPAVSAVSAILATAKILEGLGFDAGLTTFSGTDRQFSVYYWGEDL